MKTIKIKLVGTVQGVFFRKFIKDTADEMNIRGFVRNLNDGTLEIFAEGRDERVNEFLIRCKQGPSHADVKKAEVDNMKFQDFKGFKILKM